MTADDARAKHLETLHAVVSAALACRYNDLLRPSFEADELCRALDAEAQASRVVTRLANEERQAAAQPSLLEVA